jgi:surface protein
MKLKKVLAVVMSLCLTAGAVSYGAPVITQSITAQAASVDGIGYSYDVSTGVLTLKGNVDGDSLLGLSYRDKVKKVIAEKGTVFPEDSHSLFSGFINCYSFDLSNADTSKVTNMNKMFYGCVSISQLDLSGFDTSNVLSMIRMFEQCKKLTAVDVSGFDTSNVTNMKQMFYYCQNLSSIDVSGFNTSKVTDMSEMFYNCSKLTSLDVSGFDTGNVKDMTLMFGSCLSLTTLDVSGFDTSRVTNMCNMFGCPSLTKLDVSGFDTSRVTNMQSMFFGCISLTSLDVSGFDTSKVETMNGMFARCYNLTSLNVSGFDTSNVGDMYSMFSDCSSLTELDLSNFDISNVKNMEWMFSNCSALNSLTLGEKFTTITQKTYLPNGEGWVNVKAPKTVVSGDEKFAVIENIGKNTYKRIFLTYPKNIHAEYSKIYHQVKFTWDKVGNADRYGIAVYLAGKWRVQKQDITGTVYTSPKNLTPGKSYKVAIAARVDGKWDTANAIKNAVTVTIR